MKQAFMIDVLRNHNSNIPENTCWNLEFCNYFYTKMMVCWCEIKPHKYDQDSPPTKYVTVEKKKKSISLFCTCYKSLVSSAQKTRKKGKKVVKTNNGGNLCSLFPLIQIKKANNFLPMHDCCTINNFQRWWFRVCIM